MTNLIIPVGLPGCGKSTWAENFGSKSYSIVSTDTIREQRFGSLKEAHAGEGTDNPDMEKKQANNAAVFDEFHEKIDYALKHDVDVIADATNLGEESRLKLRGIANRYDAHTHLMLFTNVATAIVRNSLRTEDLRVPPTVMERFIAKYLLAVRTIPLEKYTSKVKIESF